MPIRSESELRVSFDKDELQDIEEAFATVLSGFRKDIDGPSYSDEYELDAFIDRIEELHEKVTEVLE